MENAKVTEAQFQFADYLVEQCSITQTGLPVSDKMHFEINPFGELDKDHNLFFLTLDVKVHDIDSNFVLTMKIKGTFAYETTNMERLVSFISLNSPAIMFPYIRAYVSSLSSLSGRQPIIMPTLNVQHVGMELKKQMEKML